MKTKVIIIISLCFFTLFSYSQKKITKPAIKEKPNTKIEKVSGVGLIFKSEKIEFGAIKQFSGESINLEYINNGTEPLSLYSINPSCACLSLTFSKEPLLPGKSSIITVKHNTEKLGPFTNTLLINSNATNQNIKVITIVGEVVDSKVNDNDLVNLTNERKNKLKEDESKNKEQQLKNKQEQLLAEKNAKAEQLKKTLTDSKKTNREKELEARIKELENEKRSFTNTFKIGDRVCTNGHWNTYISGEGYCSVVGEITSVSSDQYNVKILYLTNGCNNEYFAGIYENSNVMKVETGKTFTFYYRDTWRFKCVDFN